MKEKMQAYARSLRGVALKVKEIMKGIAINTVPMWEKLNLTITKRPSTAI